MSAPDHKVVELESDTKIKKNGKRLFKFNVKEFDEQLYLEILKIYNVSIDEYEKYISHSQHMHPNSFMAILMGL